MRLVFSLPENATVIAVEDSLAAEVHAGVEGDMPPIEKPARGSGRAAGALDVKTE
jgi:hypothetical protein